MTESINEPIENPLLNSVGDPLLEVIANAKYIKHRLSNLILEIHQVNFDTTKFLQNETFQGYSQSQAGKLGDLGGTLKEIVTKIEDIRKETNARIDLLSKVITSIYMKYFMMNQDLKSFKGDEYISIPGFKQSIAIPKKGSAEYQRFLRSIGVPENIISSAILELSYNELAEYYMLAISRGEKLDGLENMKKYDSPKVTFRRLV